jgi:uncharacterized repeat protein (TIGR01451 family)
MHNPFAMNKLNNVLNRRTLASLSLLCIVGVQATGCQSRQLSWLGAQNSGKPSMREQLEVSSMPTALVANSSEGTLPPRASSPVQLAEGQSADVNSDSVQRAMYANRNIGNQPDTSVEPAQYSPVGPSRGSENVPRIAMVPTQIALPPGPPPSMSAGPRAQLASHPNGHVHSAGCGCNHGTGAYRPFYPRFSGNQGCGACGNSSCSGECGGCMVDQGFSVPRATDPQEYIFDGGDHDPRVRLRADLSQVGLDPEDTVIQYETVDGKTNVESGCRVAIYAPRFASVRKVQSTRESELAMRPRTTLRPDGPGIIRDQLPSAKVTQPLKSLNSDNVRVVEAIRDRNRPMPSEMLLPMVTISEAFKPYEDLSLIRNGDLKTTDLAKLAKATAAAKTWTNVEEIHVLIDGQEAVELTNDKKAAEVTLYEHKGARIRLCKVASEQMANPGDTISFTIRFDNVGEQPLKNLVITDSLAPRLEYVDNSQQASLPAKFSMTSNSVGSSVLRWELEQGLKAGDGGLVRFSCKVR